MQTVLALIETISAAILTLLILLQARGAGLGSTFGGANLFYRSKRGAERVLFTATVVIAVLFSLISLISVVLLS